MASRVRVPRTGIAFGGWKGILVIEGDVLRVIGDNPANSLYIDCTQILRCSFNTNNGLWSFRMKDRRKVYLQTAGIFLSADRSIEGRQAVLNIAALLRKHQVKGFLV